MTFIAILLGFGVIWSWAVMVEEVRYRREMYMRHESQKRPGLRPYAPPGHHWCVVKETIWLIPKNIRDLKKGIEKCLRSNSSSSDSPE